MIFRALLPVDAQSSSASLAAAAMTASLYLSSLLGAGVDGQHNRCAPSGPDDGIVICRAIHPQVPVLSPTAQSAGTAARMRWLPVVFPLANQQTAAAAAQPVQSPVSVFVSFVTARGDEVSRASPGWRSSAQLPAVQTERGIADRAHEGRQPGRAAQLLQQQIGGGVITVLHGGRGQLRHRHACCQIFFRDG